MTRAPLRHVRAEIVPHLLDDVGRIVLAAGQLTDKGKASLSIDVDRPVIG